MGIFIGFRVPNKFPVVFAYNNHSFISACGTCSEVVFDFEWRDLFWFIEGQIHFSTSSQAKLSLNLNEPI